MVAGHAFGLVYELVIPGQRGRTKHKFMEGFIPRLQAGARLYRWHAYSISMENHALDIVLRDVVEVGKKRVEERNKKENAEAEKEAHASGTEPEGDAKPSIQEQAEMECEKLHDGVLLFQSTNAKRSRSEHAKLELQQEAERVALLAASTKKPGRKDNDKEDDGSEVERYDDLDPEASMARSLSSLLDRVATAQHIAPTAAPATAPTAAPAAVPAAAPARVANDRDRGERFDFLIKRRRELKKQLTAAEDDFEQTMFKNELDATTRDLEELQQQ